MNTTDPHILSQREAQIRREADQRIAELAAQREAEIARRHPFNVATAHWQLLAQKIARVERYRETQVQLAANFRDRVDAMLDNENVGTALDFTYVVRREEAETNAERAIVEIDRWLAVRNTELVAAKAEAARLEAELALPLADPVPMAATFVPEPTAPIAEPARGTAVQRY